MSTTTNPEPEQAPCASAGVCETAPTDPDNTDAAPTREDFLADLDTLYGAYLDELRAAAKKALSGDLSHETERWYVIYAERARVKLERALADLYPDTTPADRVTAYLVESDRSRSHAFGDRVVRNEGRPCAALELEVAVCATCRNGLVWEAGDDLGSVVADCCGAHYYGRPLALLVERAEDAA